RPRLTPDVALEKGLTYDMPLKATTTLTNKQTGHHVTQDIFLGDIPAMTPQGTFIINGIERCVVNQLVRSPGIYFTGQVDAASGKTLHSCEIRPMHGSWLEFIVTRNNVLMVRIDRRRKFVATTFLRAIGYSSNEDISALFADVDTNPDRRYLEATFSKDTTTSQADAVLELYKKLRPGEPIVLDNAQELLRSMFFDVRRYSLERVGRYKMNKKLGLSVPNSKEHWVLTHEDIIGSLRYLMGLSNGVRGDVDDIDHLGNRRVRRVGELVASNSFRVGLLRLERSVREKMSLAGPTAEDLVPTQLVNARPIIAAINDFFRTSQLSTILDQTNPLAEIDNLRRLTVMGVGGISRERASFSIRDINASQYGRIDCVRSPEGPNIGLVTYMALYARVNEYGFLETPYRRIEKIESGQTTRMRVTSDIVYLSADDEQYHYITHAGIKVSEDQILLDDRVPVRYKGEFLEADSQMAEYIDLIPRQVVGAPASLIPFLAHEEANRALMGTHMQCQAVPLIHPQSPVVGTGMEAAVSGAMGRVTRALEDGLVVYADASHVIVDYKDGQRSYSVVKFKRSAQSTSYNQRVLVTTGTKIAKDQVVIDGPASENGELALGANVVIAYMSYDGLGYEDAIVISDRLVKEDVLTSITIEEHEASVVDTKLGAEETTRDIPNVGEEALRNLDENGIVVVGAEVGPNDILVGKIAPKGETELTAEERLLRAIFGEKAREVRDTSLRMPHGERGTIIDVRILDREKGDELEPGTNRKIIVKIAQIRKVVVGDKLAGRHGNKGVISKIVPQADMPYLSDGTTVDVIISPLSVLSRMNLGQLLEAHLGIAAQKVNMKVALPVFESFNEDKIVAMLEQNDLPKEGKSVLFDGRSGEAFLEPVVVGIGYIMKLIHMVEDKTHARSTGPYSLVTQQPLGGKAQMGGQRLGEMEVWALEAHRAAYILQEMLTIKSDDVVGRAKAFEAIVKGVDIPASTVPESFKVLVKELQALGLHVIPTGVVTAKPIAPAQTATTPTDDAQVKKEAEEIAKVSADEEAVHG
ncbi:MAG: DNA-directed RNA polymerase subunit beta, partial [bacterium]|nr:DNA-directed RNA polymerase subunit beta [bacterium]